MALKGAIDEVTRGAVLDPIEKELPWPRKGGKEVTYTVQKGKGSMGKILLLCTYGVLVGHQWIRPYEHRVVALL